MVLQNMVLVDIAGPYFTNADHDYFVLNSLFDSYAKILGARLNVELPYCK